MVVGTLVSTLKKRFTAFMILVTMQHAGGVLHKNFEEVRAILLQEQMYRTNTL